MRDWLNEKLKKTFGRLNYIWFSDEAHFQPNGIVNNHNNAFGRGEKLKEISEKRLKGPKVISFVAFNATRGLLGPHWFDETGRTDAIK